MPIHNPVFIVGTERSGSNLLRLILDAHSNIAIPHPPHVMRYFSPIASGYGDLTSDRAFRSLIHDVARLARHHIYPWEVPIDEEQLVATAPTRSVFGATAALYEQYRLHVRKPRWGCKSTFMIEHAPAIFEHFPDAQLLWLVRDPRDVAASSRRSIFSTYHPYFTACLWRDQQNIAIELSKKLPVAAIHLVRYERLIREPEATVRDICEFLREPFESAVLRYFETREAKRSASLSASWRNTGEPFLSMNSGKYRSELSPAETLVVEAIAREPMAHLGYVRENDDDTLARLKVGPRELVRFWRQEQEARLRAELRSLREDRNVWRRWKRDAIVTYLTMRRKVPAALPWRVP